MPRITLPDGSVREFDQPVSAAQVAADIGAGLAKAAIGARINDVLSDLSTPIADDAEIAIVTAIDRKTGESTDDALQLIRHSCAHVMAEAIQRIVPGVQLVYGPPLDTGFYYDMAAPDNRPLSSDDFAQIEAEMAKIIADDRVFTRYEKSIDDGMDKLRAEGGKYKIDNAEKAVEKGAVRLSWYATGEPGADWEDLCMGPHLPSTGRIGAFKIMSLASSYWHGDADSDRLTRVYGVAFADGKQLERHLAIAEEAKKRDHRVLGKQLQLFHIDESVGQGLVLWMPNGAVIRTELQNFIGDELRKQGYHDVYTPHIGKLDLYKTSGHFPYDADSQFVPLMDREFLKKAGDDGCSCSELANMMEAGEVEGYLLKPMNCPHHIKIYSSQPRSYRDLPVRLSEFGTVYRWEQSGELSGMIRVRSFTIDDAHIFCREEQLGDEVRGCLSLVKVIFETIGLADFRVRVGLRDPDSSKYVGAPETWDKAEKACREAAGELGTGVSEEPGEAAFYGPKIDFIVRDVLGREWQLGTIQVDYNLPERFDLSYIGPDNKPHRPVMIHRAPFGSMERFVGVLIEHFAGAFPTWLAPEQVRIMTVSDKSESYGKRVLEALVQAGVRATLDTSSDRIQGKVRIAADMRIPYLLVVGPNDEAENGVSVRARGIRQNLGSAPLEAFVSALGREIAERGRSTVVEALFEPAAVG